MSTSLSPDKYPNTPISMKYYNSGQFGSIVDELSLKKQECLQLRSMIAQLKSKSSDQGILSFDQFDVYRKFCCFILLNLIARNNYKMNSISPFVD